jgi:hypothetical protein
MMAACSMMAAGVFDGLEPVYTQYQIWETKKFPRNLTVVRFEDPIAPGFCTTFPIATLSKSLPHA